MRPKEQSGFKFVLAARSVESEQKRVFSERDLISSLFDLVVTMGP